MLRLDVDSGDLYAIPPDNPYVNDPSYLPEIWAVGLRNPWRYSFDRATGDLYIGDVGQGSWEELNRQPASSTGGEDYGWSIMEGQHCYPPQSETCDQSGLTLPILEYPNDDAGDPAGCSIVAGNVYRGSDYPFMDGVFLFGDWCSGQIYAGYQNASGGWSQATLLYSGVTITSFGEDEAGELYLSAQSTGTVYRLHFATDEQLIWDAESFQTTWARTDQPVSDLAVSRTWIWGPGPNTFRVTEPYAEAPDGSRMVQYFDKSRMEITNPAGDSSSIWFVTNGLLVNEMMSGQLQVGDASFEPRQPAEINVAGDADDPAGITYAMLAGFRDQDPYADGATIATVLQPDGATTTDDALAAFGVTAGALSPETNHRTASVFWDFMNSSGLVNADGQLTEDQLFINPYYATGLPVTEAYWTLVRVGGVPKQVLLQCFERRCLTYTPDNDPGWRTEAGNVGLHYFAWRHEG